MTIKTNINSAEDIGISKPTFLAGSVGAFSAGLLFGVWRVTRKEQTRITVKTHRPQILFALSALGWGTVLCLGTFGLAGAIFSYSTGVTTISEFDSWAKTVGRGMNIPKPLETEKSQAESRQIESDLNKFFETILSGETNAPTNSGVDTGLPK